jgi:thiol-disulfide isomerase/thioredoxin
VSKSNTYDTEIDLKNPLSLVVATVVLVAQSSIAFASSPAPGLEKAKSFQVRIVWSARRVGDPLKPQNSFDVQVVRPGKIAVEKYSIIQSGADEGKVEPRYPGRSVSDGTVQYDYMSVANQFLKLTPAPPGRENNSILLFHFEFEPLLAASPYAGYESAGEEELNGEKMRVFTCAQTVSGYTNKLYVSKTIGLPARLSAIMTKDGTSTEMNRFDYLDWKLNPIIKPEIFVWRPPADATPFQILQSKSVLPDNVDAPDITVEDKDGKPIKLSDFKGKVVVLDFWATWCGPCIASLPHTEKVAKKYAGKDVVVIAVCMNDEKDRFKTWLDKHPDLRSIRFGFDSQGGNKAYKVSTIPTQYVIDRSGKIVKSMVGFGGPDETLEDAIKAAGHF